MATFTDPFSSLPGTIVNLEDGHLTPPNEKTAPAVLVIGTASAGPSDRLVPVDRVGDATSKFGTNGTLARGLSEAAQAGASNLVAYRIGAKPASMKFIGDNLHAAGATIATVDGDASVSDNFRVLYDEAEAVHCDKNAGGAVTYTVTNGLKRLRVYDSSGNLTFDNDPVGGAVVDTGEVTVSGKLLVSQQGPSVGDDLQARATDQHNLLVDRGEDADGVRCIGGSFNSLNFDATLRPMKLLIERSLKDFEECDIKTVDSQTEMTLTQAWPVASDCESEGVAGKDAEIDGAIADANGEVIFLRNLTTDGAAGADNSNDAKRVTVYGLDKDGAPIQETLVVANSTGGGADDSANSAQAFKQVTAVRLDNALVAGGGGDGEVEVRTAGDGVVVEILPADAADMALDDTVHDGAREGLFGAAGFHHNHDDADGQSLVLRGPGMTVLHTLPAGEELTVTRGDAANNDVTVWAFGYDEDGWPTQAKHKIAGAGPTDLDGNVKFKQVTGIALSSPVQNASIVIKEKDSGGTVASLASGSIGTGMLAENVTLSADANLAGMVSTTGKFSGIHQVELGQVDANANDIKVRKLRMFRVVRDDVGEVMSLSEWANDGHATTTALSTNTTTKRGVSASPLVLEGSDGLSPDRESLFELLQAAYRELEAAPVDFVVPMDVYLDDANVGDDATLATQLDNGADGEFLTADADSNGELFTFTSAGGGFNAHGIKGKNQATLVITEATFQDANLKDLRRSAKVASVKSDTKLVLDRALVTAQTQNLDWVLIGKPDFEASDHLRFFRQFQDAGEWKYEWWHEADKQDPDGNAYNEVNFAYQLANFCYQLSTNDNNALGAIGVKNWSNKSAAGLASWLGIEPVLNASGAVQTNGSGLTGNKYLAGLNGWSKGFFANSAKSLANYPDDTDIIVDTNGNNVDIGKYLSIVAAWPNFSNSFDSTGKGYLASGAAAYAGMVSRLDPGSSPLNKSPGRGIRMPVVLGKADRNRLAASRLVWFNASDRGVLVDDAPTASLATSDYNRLTTMRICNAAVELVRRIAAPFIGEAFSAAVRMSMENAINKRLAELRSLGYLRRFSAVVSATPNQQILGLATVDLVLVPAFELRKISITLSLARE